MGLGYRILRSVANLILAFQMRLEIRGIERLPRTGPLLLVSNHLGLTDQFAIAMRLPHEVRILAKAELFEWPILGWLARRSKVVPIRRGEADRDALRTVRDLLRSGAWVLVFPEGTFVSASGPVGMLSVKTGAAWLAWHTGVMVVPVAITGTEAIWAPSHGWRFWHRPRVRVTFGVPYKPAWPEQAPPKTAWRAAADEMAQRIAALLPEAYRGVYARPAPSRSDGEPALPQSAPRRAD